MTSFLQEKNKQTLNNIKQLQEEEQKLYTSLNNVTLTPEQRQLIVNKINEISQMRMNLYATLKDAYVSYQQNASESNETLSQQIQAIDILENELNESKRKINLINQEKENKLRLVEINDYYGKRYIAHTELMKTIVYMCVPIFVLSMLYHNGILPFFLFIFLCMIIFAYGTYYAFLQFLDILNRDDRYWDEYNWYFNKKEAPSYEPNKNKITKGGIEITNPWETPKVTCIGSACCPDGTIYDSDQNMCIVTNKCNNEKEKFGNMDKYGYSQLKSTPLNQTFVNSMSSLDKF